MFENAEAEIKKYFKNKEYKITHLDLRENLHFTVFGVTDENNYFVSIGYYSEVFKIVNANFNIFRELTPINIHLSFSEKL